MKKKILSILLVVCMVLTLVPPAAFAEATVTDVTYYAWNDETEQLEQTTCPSATVVTSGSSIQWTDTAANKGWYVAQGDVTIEDGVTVDGDVHLILKDGCSLTVQNGIKANGNLTIYAQSTGDGQGHLTATGKPIAGENYLSSGISFKNLTINGGVITATGGDGTDNVTSSFTPKSFGISGESGTLTINGGSLTATGGTIVASIGYSYGIYCGQTDSRIRGGTVEAKGGQASVSHGFFTVLRAVKVSGSASVTATGAAGLYSTGLHVGDGNLTVSGSASVTANGAAGKYSTGLSVSDGNLTVSDSTSVTAAGGEGNDESYGIQLITNSSNCTMSISGGTVIATGGSSNQDSAGISLFSGLPNLAYTVSISGGHVIAQTLAESGMGPALSHQPELSSDRNYYWRIAANGDFTISSTDGYTHSSNQYYVEILYPFTITLDPNYEGAVSSTVTAGTDGTLTEALPTLTREGYTFAGWFTEAQGGTAVTGETVFDRDSTIYAHWTANQYTITYKGMDDATHGENHPKIHTFGTETVISNPTKTGYTFNGWKVNDGETLVQDLTLGAKGYTDAITLTAQWTINQYTITFNTDGGTAIDPITKDYGKAVNAPADPTKAGYTFAGWDKTIPSTMPAENVTIKALWTENSTGSSSSSGGGFSGVYNYPVVISDVENGKATVDKTNAVAGDKVTITVTPDAGKMVDQVVVTDADGKAISVTKAGNNQYTFTMPAGKVNIAVTTKAADYQKKIVLQIGNRNILENDATITNDVAPVIVDNRTMVPIRVITETLGGTAHWNADTQTVTLNIDGKTLTMTIGQTISGFDTAPIILNDRTYVPVRYVAERLGASVEWIGESQQIIITK